MTQARAENAPDREPVDDGACYVCGPHNPGGLRLGFEPDGTGGARASVTLDPLFQGYRGIAHGGIVMLLLDEVMAYAAGFAGEKVMTAAVTVRFRAPVPLGAPLTLEGRVVSKRAKILKAEAALRDAAGTLLAGAEGSFAVLGAVDPAQLGNRAGRTTV